MFNPSFSLSGKRTASRQNYQRLQILRSLVVVVLAVILLVFQHGMHLHLNYPVLSALLAALALVNGLSWIRCFKPWPITDQEFFINFLLDILLVSALLYFSGGATNPFVSYFLVPLTIAAATLPKLYTWLIAGISLGAYGTLFFFYEPLPAMAPHHGHGAGGFNLHLLGMWINFSFSVGIISFFVVKMSSALNRQAELLAMEREERLRDEQIIGVATVAAGTAHELGTPLSTIKTLVSELHHAARDETAREDLKLIEQQVDICADTLQRLVKKADQLPGRSPEPQPVADYFSSIIEQWRILRPDVSVDIDLIGDAKATSAFHPSLNQAILNLLNNAADAEPEGIEVVAQWDHNALVIDIYDRGAGVSSSVAETLGAPFISDKDQGLGLGFFLSNATLNRFGGSATLYQRAEGGTHTRITLPLDGENNA